MHLPEIFDFREMLKVESWKSKIFDCQKLSENKTLFFWFPLSQNSYRNYQNFLKLSTFVKNSGICLTFLTFDCLCRKLTAYYWHFFHFLSIKVFEMAQIRPNQSKMTQKMVENHENYTGIFDRRLLTSGLMLKMYWNVPVQGCHENVPEFKNLTVTHALMFITRPEGSTFFCKSF